MGLRFEWKHGKPTTGTMDASSIRPYELRDVPLTELASRTIQAGNRSYTWSDIFDITAMEGDEWSLPGNPNYLYLAAGLTSFALRVRGDAGDYAGMKMTGGQIIVEGSVGHAVGASMQGGIIRVAGDAGMRTGGPAPGSFDGMTDGEILILGRTGEQAGYRMRRGLIAVHSCDQHPGYHMQGGTLVVLNGSLQHPGISMRRGTIISLDRHTKPDCEPHFQPDCSYNPVVLRLIFQRLLSLQFPISEKAMDGIFQQYSGDRLTTGKGELFHWSGMSSE
ncbi:MAG: formylmethanofuran dehydrogenase subunit C [Planctomycetia bacterium]|nr:formylmethanofuran dehydrogenase subunit C [Planctomycetia bacterium]